MVKYRAGVPFDTEYFKKEETKNQQKSTKEKFTHIYNSNHWGSEDSASGNGSDLIQTEKISAELPRIISEYGIETMLDLPCGDHNWMNRIELPLQKYIGADIVEEIISKNKACYESEKKKFIVIDLIKDPLPNTDLIFCRDCLVHLSSEDILKSLKNIKDAGIKYIMTTTFPECEKNEDIVTGDWRILNLTLSPFGFPEPIEVINENCMEGEGTYSDKSLGLWKVNDII